MKNIVLLLCIFLTVHVIHAEKSSDVHIFFRYTGKDNPIISGHRGGIVKGFPENSIESFENTLKHVPAFFEIDPRLTRDSVIVLMHDATLDRTTNGTGKLSDYTWEELQQFNLKDVEENVTDFRIPTLESAIEWARGKTFLNLDIKDVPPEMYVDMIKRLKAESVVMLTVHNPEQAMYYYKELPSITLMAHILTKEAFEAYEIAGLPWKQSIAYIGAWMKPENQELYQLIHAKGTMCMISSASSYDKLHDISERRKAYTDIFKEGADILESDLPIEVGDAVKSIKVEFVRNDAEKKVDVMIDGQLFTSYLWHDPAFRDIKKPVLYPVITAAGTEITRGFPIKPRPGERTDHPHHIGLCFNYGHVNGYDFWNNSTAIPENRRDRYGTIKHVGIDKLSGSSGQGLMITRESWIDPSGVELLAEQSEYYFISKGSLRIIDRIIKLTATSGDVAMKDTKEGGFGVRVARQLEMPSNEELILTDAHGIPATVKVMSNEGITGNYRNSNGVEGEAVYSTRGNWVILSGMIGNEAQSVVMIDHPGNPGHPTYWHARGYGLLLANPLGAGEYSNGKDVMDFKISAGQSATFKFRLVVCSKKILSDDEINALTAEFAKKY